MSKLIGQFLLNRYQVKSFLGRGGMAEVYKVWDSQRMTYLAMKVVHDKIAQNRVFLEHFRKEADTLSKLKHPNIVRFYGFEQDNSRSYILMDFIEGETLKVKIFNKKKKPLSLKEIKEIMRPLLSALQYAHNQEMIHCDIKPANIMINKEGKVLLTDFGIARATYLDNRALTSSGTPAYMAPEQVENQPLSPATDIYALGIILFEMLTGGTRPFNGTQAQIQGRTGQKIRWEQVHRSPPSLYRINPSVNPAINDIVVACLEKNPSHRYQDATALSNALVLVKEKSNKAPTVYAEPDTHPKKKKKKGSKVPLIILLGIILIGMIALIIELLPPPSSNPMPAPVASSVASQSPLATSTAHMSPTIISPSVATNTPFAILVRPYNEVRDADAKTFDIADWEPLMQPAHTSWHVDFSVNTKAHLMLGWCANDKATLRQNLLSINNKVSIDGFDISLANFATTDYQRSDGAWCQSHQAILTGWQSGNHTYIWQQNFSTAINDGWDTYPAGDYIMELNVDVR